MTRALHLFTATGAMRAWAATTLTIVCFGLGLGFTIGYVKKVDAESARRNAQIAREAEARNVERSREICGLIIIMDDAYQAQPPVTELGQRLAVEVHRYRATLGC